MWFNPRMGMGPHRRGGLRMMLVSMLRQAPRNGAELIDQIEMMSQGWWRPSPGSVYPLLDEMQKEGIIQKREDGKYELTEKADQDYMWPWGTSTKQPRTVDEMVTEMNSYILYLEDIAKSDKSKIAPYIDKLKSIKDRLAVLLEPQ
ncbi:MAG: PadR family transcriptional regulator [Candidatus Bathyarchaeia archaeon]